MKNSPDKLSAFHKGQILTEGLILVREDICDWINKLFSNKIITGDSFLPNLHDGIVLCDLINQIYQHIPNELPFKWPRQSPSPDRKAKVGSFKAKDNITLFLNWCRNIGLPNTILFETRGLTNSDEEKNIVLTLLHIGEICVDFDMPVPEFARFHKEMMMSKPKLTHTTSVYTLGDTSDLGSMESGSISARSDSNIFDTLDSESSLSVAHESTGKLGNPRSLSSAVIVSTATDSTTIQTRINKKPSTTSTDHSSNLMVDKTFNILKYADQQQQQQVRGKNIVPNVEIKSKYIRKNNKNIKAIKSGEGGINNDHNQKQRLIRSKSRDSVLSIPKNDSPIIHQSNFGNIDLKIKEITNRCQCHTKFLIEKTTLQEGMYKIGSKNIFVRMFRGNVMLRVGGGWETLNEYLNKVDPCYKVDNRSNNSCQRRQSTTTISTTLYTDATADKMISKNLRKLSQWELKTVKKKTERDIYNSTCCK